MGLTPKMNGKMEVILMINLEKLIDNGLMKSEMYLDSYLLIGFVKRSSLINTILTKCSKKLKNKSIKISKVKFCTF